MPPQPSIETDVRERLALSPQDVERLLTDESPAVRIDVVKKMARGHKQNTYSPRERSIAEQIFRIVLRDTAVVVRETLANILKDNPYTPRDIVMALISDMDSIALPVIEYSQVLTDDDLMAIIHTVKQPARNMAIARRSDVSEKISAALVETHHTQTVTQLMKNPGAVISDNIYNEVLRFYSEDSAIMTAVAERPSLPPAVAEKVIAVVSDVLAEKLRARYQITPATITQETDKARELATLKMADGRTQPREIEKLVDQLHVFGKLTPSIILTSLCRGNLYFFETSLAHLSNIPVRNAQLLIHDKGGLGFKALYSKAGLPDKFLAPSKLLLEVVASMQRAHHKETGASYADALAKSLLAKASGQNIENLAYIIALIRQNA